MSKKAFPAFLAFVLIFGSVEAFAAAAKDPESIAQAYFEALKSGQYDKAAEFYRDNDLNEFKSLFIPIYEAEQKEGKKDFLNASFPNLSVEEVKAVNPKQFFKSIIDFVFKSSPMGKPTLTKMKIIGSLNEPDAKQTHVLTRSYVKVGALESNKLEPLSFTQEGGEWKMVMPDQMKAIGQAIQKGIAMRQQKPH